MCVLLLEKVGLELCIIASRKDTKITMGLHVRTIGLVGLYEEKWNDNINVRETKENIYAKRITYLDT